MATTNYELTQPPAPQERKPALRPLIVPMNRRQINCVLFGAVMFDIGVRRGVANGAATVVMILGITAAVAASGLIRRPSGYWLLLASIPFSLMLAVRADPRLTAFNLIAAVGLIIAATTHQWARSIFDYRPSSAFGDALEAVILIVIAPVQMVGGGIGRIATSAGRPKGGSLVMDVIVGAALALPVLLGLGALLGSADPVFLALLTAVPFDVTASAGHLLLIALGAIILVVLLQLAGRAEPEYRLDVVTGALGRRQVEIVLGSVVALFGVFALAQALAVFGLADGALEAAGESYKDYARQGFFQLLWVAGLTLAILLSLRVLTDPAQRYARSTVRLNLAVIALTVLIAVVALVRLNLYISNRGLTPLRFYSAVFSVWVIVGLLISAVRLAGRWSDLDWLSTALVASGLVFLFGLNAINPEGIIAHENVDDGNVAWKIDRLSVEGWNVVATRSSELDQEQQAVVAETLCDIDLTRSPLDWNLGVARAQKSVDALCR